MMDATKAAILAHAKAEYPRECCGLVAVVRGKERYFPCRNLSDFPEQEFLLAPEDYADVARQGEIIAIAHSHVHIPPIPSEADRAMCEQTGVLWVITNPQTEEWGQCEPCGYEAPLVGRVHHWGTLDCWTLVWDWYKRERGVELLNVSRRRGFWRHGENPLGDNWRRAGFRELQEDEDLETGDILLMQMGDSDVPNHVALYIGDDEILHHAEGRLSSRDVFGGYYRKHTVKRLRYVENHPSLR